MAMTNEELEAQLKVVTDNTSRELTQIKIQVIQTTTRLESFIRMMVKKQGIKFDDFIDFIDAYIKFSNTVLNINKVTSISDRVTAAISYNKEALVPIYADDLNVLPSVKATGSISKVLHKHMFNLPYTERFAQEVEKLIKEGDVEPGSSPLELKVDADATRRLSVDENATK